MNLIPRNFFLDDFFDDFGKGKNNDMKCDVYEEGNNYIVEMDIPGFDKDEISANGPAICTGNATGASPAKNPVSKAEDRV